MTLYDYCNPSLTAPVIQRGHPTTNGYSIGRFSIRNERQPLKAKGRLKANGLFSGEVLTRPSFTFNDNEEAFQKLKTALEEPQELQPCSTSPDLTHIPFCGSLSAKVAAMLLSRAENFPNLRSVAG
ncbi:hypothetical protein BDV33DRAFT_211042 [Aspergillus novoparasiticus]|uniref:Uncharacterized protein n=1 Tax=Aspergillus novoparasiticus TaxID=986946 RepID=A0A5N6E8D9_9EURO|nr:hypothetical protein BDV33DRAFT_211042 [Aspergillus novoparasiticus]